MIPNTTIFAVFLLSQICIGVTVNSSLLLLLLNTFLFQPQLRRPIDSIMVHLTIVNIFTIIITLIPYVKFSLGVRHFLDDVGCKVMLYLSRVTRGVSIGTTSLLSTFQAITILPVPSKWVLLRSKLAAWIISSLLFFWIINMLIHIIVIKRIRAIDNFTLVGPGYSQAYCQTRPMRNNSAESFLSLILMHDLLFLALMLWSSLYMVSVLYRHHRRVQHVHSPSAQTAPEIKATRNILFLTSCFVFFYCLNNFLTFYSFYIHKKNPSWGGIGAVLSSCYPTICPFILMKNNKIVPQFMSCIRMRIIHLQRVFGV